jgi:RecB family endonuclease NucS
MSSSSCSATPKYVALRAVHLGFLWVLVGCLQTISGLTLFSSSPRHGTEARMTKTIARQLSASGYTILGKNQKLVREVDRQLFAEFDLIARDPHGQLSLIEIKFRIEPSRKVTHQLDRYVSFLRGQSPFQEPVKRVIVISPPVSEAFAMPWRELGLEFFQFFGDRVIEN